MQVAISQITTLPANLEVDLPAFSRAGFRAVELSLEKVTRYVQRKSNLALRDLLEELELRAVGAIGLAPKGPALLLSRGDTFSTYIASLRRQLALCRELGVDRIGIGADASKWRVEGRWQKNAIENVKVASRIAEDEGVRIGLEFLSLGPPIGPFILDSLESTMSLIEAVSSSALGVNVDFFHHFRSGGSSEDLSTIEADCIVTVHVTDVLDRPLAKLTDGDRVLPGEGVLPIFEYRDAIFSAGYNGAWTLELLNEMLWHADVDLLAPRAAEAMQFFVAASRAAPNQ
jgi:2-keto-myo-inositol isomerase